jgi:hypothetical protein
MPGLVCNQFAHRPPAIAGGCRSRPRTGATGGRGRRTRPACESPICLKWGQRGDAGETPPVLRSRNFAGRAAKAHAIFHVIVENQAALGDEIPVRGTLDRLMGEGLDRHEAIHAVASVLSGHVFDIARGKPPRPDPNAAYFAALGKLTVET